MSWLPDMTTLICEIILRSRRVVMISDLIVTITATVWLCVQFRAGLRPRHFFQFYVHAELLCNLLVVVVGHLATGAYAWLRLALSWPEYFLFHCLNFHNSIGYFLLHFICFCEHITWEYRHEGLDVINFTRSWCRCVHRCSHQRCIRLACQSRPHRIQTQIRQIRHCQLLLTLTLANCCGSSILVQKLEL